MLAAAMLAAAMLAAAMLAAAMLAATMLATAMLAAAMLALFPRPSHLQFLIAYMHAASDKTLDGEEAWEQGYCNAALWLLKSFAKRFFMEDITWEYFWTLSTFAYPPSPLTPNRESKYQSKVVFFRDGTQKVFTKLQ